MTEPLNPDYCVNCQKCGKMFEMVWGKDNDVCEECELPDLVMPRKMISREEAEEMYPPPPEVVQVRTNETVHPHWTEATYVRSGAQTISVRELMDVHAHYANPDNWRRFPIDTGIDANGSPVEQYFWIGDGGAYARGETAPRD